MRFELKSPMPGKVQSVLVAEGDSVEPTTVTMKLEAMKMDVPVAARQAGRVKEIKVKPAQMVEQGDLLMTIE
jgi:acetyl-CoA carboxylase biotin carboxyl carrier protein